MFAALIHEDLETARHHQLKVGTSDFLDKSQVRLTAAKIAALDGDPHQARVHIAESRRFLQDVMLPGVGQMYSAWLDELEVSL